MIAFYEDMAGKFKEDKLLRNRTHVFGDRSDAGQHLAAALESDIKGDEIVLAIPSGGVPVGIEIARVFSLPLDLLVVRKIQIPWNTEAGFGAVDPDGEKLINEPMLGGLGITEKDVRAQVKKTVEVISRRNRMFRHDMPFPELIGRGVVIVDDGLASGYTMLSAVRFVKKRNAARILVAVPTGSGRTVKTVLREVDKLVCLNVRNGLFFAVAEAYRNWYDLTDEEVVSLLKEFRKGGLDEIH